MTHAALQDHLASLRGLAAVIRKHGTCAPAAIEEVADRIAALSAMEGEATLRDKISDVFGIGAAVRTDSTILTNATNAARFADYLRAVEDQLFTVSTGADLEDEETPDTECLVNSWGAESAQQYVDEVKAAIAKLYTAPPPQQAVIEQAARYGWQHASWDWEAVKGGLDRFNPTPSPPQQADQHPDDIAVDKFAAAMKAKMAKQRAKGYGGWDDPADCAADFLRERLLTHIGKGDPVDVGNFAMMLWNRSESTTHPTPSSGPQGGGEAQTIAVSDLARILEVKGAAVIRSLMTFGVMATLNQRIDIATAELVVKDMKAATPPQPEAAVADIGLTSRPLPKVTARMTDAASGIDKRLSVFKLSDIFKAMHAHPDYQKQLDTFTAATVAALTTSGRDGDG